MNRSGLAKCTHQRNQSIQGKRGNIAGVLAISCLALVAGFTVATAGTWSLQLSSQNENSQIALDLADSAIAEAIAHLQKDPLWGLKNKPSITVPAVPGMPEGAEGKLTFDPAQPMYSTSHVDGNTAPAWQNRPLAAGRVHLVAQGQCRGVARTVECLIFSPKFPRAIGCDGPIELKSAFVASANILSDVVDPDGTVHINSEQMNRGDVVCNDITTLLQASRVKGAVQSKLRVDQQDGSVIEGEVLSPYQQVPLPAFDVHQYDPKADPDTVCDEVDGGIFPSSQPAVTGIRRFKSDCTFSGDLKLDNAIVYVAGDLTIQGSLSGVGAIFCEGKTSVGGSVKLNSADSIALISNGDIRLRGDGEQNSFFMGLVATTGSISADHLTIVGSLVAHNKAWISNCRTIGVESLTSLSMFREVQVVFDRMGINTDPGNLGPQPNPKKDYLASEQYFPDFGSTVTVKNVTSLQPNWKNPALLTVTKNLAGVTEFVYQVVRPNGQLEVIRETDRQTFVNKIVASTKRDWIDGHNYLPFVANSMWRNKMGQAFIDRVNGSLDTCLNYNAFKAQEGSGNFNLSLNRFISESERIRVVYRREL